MEIQGLDYHALPSAARQRPKLNTLALIRLAALAHGQPSSKPMSVSELNPAHGRGGPAADSEIAVSDTSQP
jgi:hypothetical protein